MVVKGKLNISRYAQFLRLWSWGCERCFVVIRERLLEEKPSLERKLFDVPGYTLPSLCHQPRGDIRRGLARLQAAGPYREADRGIEVRLGCRRFAPARFFATEAAFLAILMLFNLLAEFQRAVGMPRYRQPATLRVQVFLCGAILGRAGHRTVLYLYSALGASNTATPCSTAS